MTLSKKSVVTLLVALAIVVGAFVLGCTKGRSTAQDQKKVIKPVVVTEPVRMESSRNSEISNRCSIDKNDRHLVLFLHWT